MFLFPPYLKALSLKTRTKLRKFIKSDPFCCKLHFAFKRRSRQLNTFRFKDRIPKEVLYEFYYNECVRHLNVTIREHIGISPMTKKRVSSVVGNDLLFWDHYYINNFSVLIRKNRKFSLEFKESLLIMRDKPSLSRIISCAPLCLFDRI